MVLLSQLDSIRCNALLMKSNVLILKFWWRKTFIITFLMFYDYYICLPEILQVPSRKHTRPSGHEPRLIPSPLDPRTVQIGLQFPCSWHKKFSLHVPRFVPSPLYPKTVQPAIGSKCPNIFYYWHLSNLNQKQNTIKNL